MRDWPLKFFSIFSFLLLFEGFVQALSLLEMSLLSDDQHQKNAKREL